MPEIAIPSFGTKAHTSIDRRYRLTCCWEVTDASRHDGHWLRQGLLDPANTGAGVWADTAYRSQQNETFLERHGFISHIHRRRLPGRAAACTHSPRQCQALARPGSGRARVRGAEASHGTDRPHDRSRPGANEDRDGQLRLQPPAPRPTSGQPHRLTHPTAGSVCPHLLKEGDTAPQTPRAMPESLQTRRKTVDSGRQSLAMHSYSRFPGRRVGAGELSRGFRDRIQRKVRSARSSHLRVTPQLADHGLAVTERPGDIRMPQTLDPHILWSCVRADAPPARLQIGRVGGQPSCRLAPVTSQQRIYRCRRALLVGALNPKVGITISGSVHLSKSGRFRPVLNRPLGGQVFLCRLGRPAR